MAVKIHQSKPIIKRIVVSVMALALLAQPVYGFVAEQVASAVVVDAYNYAANNSRFSGSPKYIQANGAHAAHNISAEVHVANQADAVRFYLNGDLTAVDGIRVGVVNSILDRWRLITPITPGEHVITAEYRVSGEWYQVSGSGVAYSLNAAPIVTYTAPSENGVYRPSDNPVRLRVNDQYEQFRRMEIEIAGVKYAVLRSDCDQRQAGNYLLCDVQKSAAWTPLVAGTYTAKATVWSKANNRRENIVSRQFVIDDQGPIVTDFAVPTVAGSSVAVSAKAIDNNGIERVRFYLASPGDNGTCSNNLSAISGREVVVTAGVDNTYVATLDASELNGDYCVLVSARDVATHNSTSLFWPITIDTTAPDKPRNLGWTTDGGKAIANNGATNEYGGAASWGESSSQDVDHYIYKYWNDIANNQHKVGNEYTAKVSGTSLQYVFDQDEGTHHFCIVAVDRVGNESACSDAFTITYDNTAPKITSVSFDEIRSYANTSNFTGARLNDNKLAVTFTTSEPLKLNASAGVLGSQVSMRIPGISNAAPSTGWTSFQLLDASANEYVANIDLVNRTDTGISGYEGFFNNKFYADINLYFQLTDVAGNNKNTYYAIDSETNKPIDGWTTGSGDSRNYKFTLDNKAPVLTVSQDFSKPLSGADSIIVNAKDDSGIREIHANIRKVGASGVVDDTVIGGLGFGFDRSDVKNAVSHEVKLSTLVKNDTPVSLENGTYQLRISGQDLVANSSRHQNFLFTVNNEAPKAKVAVGELSSGDFTNDKNIVITGIGTPAEYGTDIKTHFFELKTPNSNKPHVIYSDKTDKKCSLNGPNECAFSLADYYDGDGKYEIRYVVTDKQGYRNDGHQQPWTSGVEVARFVLTVDSTATDTSEEDSVDNENNKDDSDDTSDSGDKNEPEGNEPADEGGDGPSDNSEGDTAAGDSNSEVGGSGGSEGGQSGSLANQNTSFMRSVAGSALVSAPVFTPSSIVFNASQDIDTNEEADAPLVAAATDDRTQKSTGSTNSDGENGEVLSASDVKNGWSLVNLILVVIVVLMSLAALPGLVLNKENRRIVVRLLTLVPAVAGLSVLFFVEDFSSSMKIVNVWTVLMVLLAILQGAIVLQINKNSTTE